MTEVENDGYVRLRGVFNRDLILVTSPQGLSEILVSKCYEFRKPPHLEKSLGPVLGHGLVLAEGEEHKVQRRNMMPAFSFRHIKDLYPLFWDKAREVVRAMTAECDGEGRAEFEVGGWASRVALDIIGTSGLGRDFEAIHDEHNEIVETYLTMTSTSAADRFMLTMSDVFSNIISIELLRKLPIPRLVYMKKASTMIRGVCRDLIHAKQRKLEKDALSDVDILSVALKSGLFTEEELINQLMTFLGAGHETTASAVTFGIYALCRHPEVQRRLREEVRNNLPSVDEETDITSVDIDSLPYLNAVCNEVLRVYSPVPQTVRQAVRDTTVQGLTVPRGTRFVLAAWGTNLDPKLWGPDAAEFKPERWLSVENGGTKSVKEASGGGSSSNYAFLSFLHGPRSCIGQSFARAEFACLMAAWVGRFDFELRHKEQMDEANVAMEQFVTVKAVKGMHVRAKIVPGF